MTAVNRLIAMRMSVTMVPPGAQSPLAAALDAMSSSASIAKHAKDASEWAKEAFAALRGAGMVGTDEDLAAHILMVAEAQRGAA